MYIWDVYNNLNSCNTDTVTSFFFLYNNLDSQPFSLNLTDNLLIQSVQNNTHLYVFKVTIYDPASSITDACFVLTVTLITVIFFKKLKIIRILNPHSLLILFLKIIIFKDYFRYYRYYRLCSINI
jgi:hypothetical protein